ncbi:SPOR domain-containing protein [Aquincola sp. S2]|uniref:SPOR domain-containing protein n=1 Tax=Pseudaquabacterium terrae TaxID=2732868 RepID=A0ABX2ECB6_9BURK|nr:SPOR domain-containing protein [Aquabacterium terrae]NRF66213.1 SPOR domain-containing protein [Aquabacterium terrae]
MLRALVVTLLLANALVFAWSQGAFDRLTGRRADAQREPERLQRQVQPELVTLLKPGAASAALAAAAKAEAAIEAAAAASAAAPPGLCLEAGPLAPGAVAAVEKLLLQAGVAAGSWQPVASERKGTFLIYMGRYADDEALERKIEELKRLRIEGQPMKNAPELMPGLVLSRFDDKTAAEAELGRLSQRGLRTARVITLVAPAPAVTLRLPAADPALRDKLSALKLGPGIAGFAACGSTPAAAVVAPIGPLAVAASVPARVASAPVRAASAPRRAAASSAPTAPAPASGP